MRKYETVVAAQSERVYEFGDFRLDSGKRLLTRDGTPVSLTAKAFDTLAYLVEHSGRVLQRDELMGAVWPDTAVEANNLNQNISILRHVLGDGRGEHRYIATLPSRGYQFVARVRVAAKAAGSARTHEPSIVVLPFVNLTGDSDYEYFGDGLAEELINTLSRLGRVRVVARTSAFSFKGKQLDIREIAEKLRVSLILEGSVRRSGNRLRITAQLINAADGYHLWSGRYNREIEIRDVFDVQDEIALAVVDALKLKLTGGEKTGALKHHTRTVKAHELYLKGRFHLYRMTPSGIKAGMSYLNQAIQSDPADALAQVGLAHAYRMFALSLEMPPGEVLPKAKAAAEKAVELDPTLAEAHAVLGFNIFWFDWAWEAAEKHFQRALRLDPKNADAHWMYAHLCSNTGRHREALDEIRQARELDPLSGLMNAMEGQFLLHAGHTDEALARLREALELDPNSRVAHLFTASAYIEKGFFAEAIAEARASLVLSPASSQAIAFEAYANAKLGRIAEARAALNEVSQLSRERFIPPYHIAMVCNGIGETAEALMWLERGFEHRDPKMVFLNVEPKWKNVRDHPRFVSLLKQMNLFA
jgi:TolB-like protein/Tfp pilus assembly protein PilF